MAYNSPLCWTSNCSIPGSSSTNLLDQLEPFLRNGHISALPLANSLFKSESECGWDFPMMILQLFVVKAVVMVVVVAPLSSFHLANGDKPKCY